MQEMGRKTGCGERGVEHGGMGAWVCGRGKKINSPLSAFLREF